MLSGPAIDRIKDSEIERMILLNTIPLMAEKRIDKIKTLSVAPLFAMAIKKVVLNESLSEIFE